MFARRLCLAAFSICVLSSTLCRAQTGPELRALLESRVGISNLRVPVLNEALPQPRLANGQIDPRFAITEDKIRLGKFLFFDPIRSTDIRPEFGGDPSTAQTASCGSCHLGEAASKAGQLHAIGVGGSGRHLTDSRLNRTIHRTELEQLTDLLPTAMELEEDGIVSMSGRFDAIDIPPRVSPSCIGFAFNQRLLWAGEAGEPNPDGYPAQEDLVRIASRAHRMASEDYSHLQDNAIYRELFARAFPDEAAMANDQGDLDLLINNDTQIRAIASFLRTVITRNTLWDRFLNGQNSLNRDQRRGAWLFAAPVSEGGANCIACHSGPALNKVLGDEAGLLVEENIQNVGTFEHPLFDLARESLNDPNVRDVGRIAVNGDPQSAAAFKSPTLRQLRDAAPYFHGGQETTLRGVVEYFNAGIAADIIAARTGSLDERFSNPRGPEVTGLGLSSDDVDALIVFLDEALYDATFITHDPSSPTKTFELNQEDLKYDEELLALGARDNHLPSGLAISFNDELSRQQMLFTRGAANADSHVDIGDPIFLLAHLFTGGQAPSPMEAGDTNDDGRLDIGDPIYLITFLFLGGPPPPYPYPDEGQDLTP